jgi:peptidoglycan/xylan/chitin deacetylase (PgdA/CDA1 family)
MRASHRRGTIRAMDTNDPPEAGARRRWRASGLIRASVALHAGAAVTVLAQPRWWPWALSACIADHLVLTGAGLTPRSRLLGPNVTHLPASPVRSPQVIAITVDDGPDPEVTPRVLDLLDAHGAKASFFCIGEHVARHPQLARAIVERGHEIGNHTYRHLARFSLLGPRAIADEIARAQEAIGKATGTVARFFRAPAGLRNPFLEPALVRADLRLVSWTRRGFDTVTGRTPRVLARLTRNLRAGDILLLHDGHAARTAAGLPVILEVLPPLLARLAAAQLAPVTLHRALAGPDELARTARAAP